MRKSLPLYVMFALAVAIMAGVGWDWYRSRIALQEADQWENHTYEVMLQGNKLLSALTDAETSQRNFLFTGSEEHLQLFNGALPQVDQALAALEGLTKDKPPQQQRLDSLEPLARARLASLKETLELRRTKGLEAAMQAVRTNRGISLMDEVRRQVGEFQAEEAKLLRERRLAKEASLARAFRLGILGGILSGVFMLVSFLGLKRQQGAIRASEIRYRRLFEAAKDGVLLVDPRTRQIKDANPFITRLLGYSREELLGQELWQIGLPQDAQANQAVWRQLQEQGHARYENLPLQTKSGEPREVEFVSNVYEEDGHSVIQCNIRDIAERKRLEQERATLLAREQAAHHEAELAREQLQAANQDLNDFATIVSHDLKAPLRGVATLAKWLQSDYADKLDEEGRDNLADMVKRVGRMDRMIEGILSYSRLGRTAEKPEPVSLAELVPAVVEDLSPPAHAYVHIAPGLPDIQGEPVRLRQLFQNLIGNAIKYADKPQVAIQVNWADCDSMWEFTIADNGPGIEERHFERIFKIFQTLAPKDKTDSTGVGLALVKRIVEGAGGRVWLESRLGQGSTFHFTWPKGPRAGVGEMGEMQRRGDTEQLAA